MSFRSHGIFLLPRKVTIQVKYIIMQNPLSVPPKDQGEVSMLTGPVEKQLARQMSEASGKTLCTGEPHVPSGTAQSKTGLQNKSQFRTIAPKLVPRVLTSGVLPYLSPSLSEHVNPGFPKPLGMPSQKYALMQLSGHEGTFSLIALPHVASAQPIQKPRMPLPKNLKVPIPRYQPPRKNKVSREKPTLSPSEGGCSKPAQTQECPQPSLSPPAPSKLPHKVSSSEHALSPYQAPASIGTAALPDGGSHRDSGPPLRDSPANLDTSAAVSLSAAEEPPAEQGQIRIAGTADLTSKKTTSKPPAMAGQKPKARVDLARATMNSFLPAIVGSTVQLISSVPKGQLPTLPYSRVKATEFCKIEPGAHIEDLSLPGPGAGCELMPPLTEGFGAATKVVPKPSPWEGAFCPAPKPDCTHRTKPSGGTAKRRGRKRKFPEELSAFQGRRRKYIVNRCKDGKDRVKNDPQEPRDQKPGALKKYRSIMPKPAMAVPAVAPLAPPAAAPQPQAPGSLGQGALFNNSRTCKLLSCKQNLSPSTKPSTGFKNGFSGIKKPWHRCHICGHHFQFKQHLRDHMDTHTDRRPYSCWVCRKAYVRPGSLSAHMKLQHTETRPKRLMCCEFCAKVFGHVKVYFGHLKEVHGVVISTEASPSEPQPGDAQLKDNRDSKTRDLCMHKTEGAAVRESKSNLEDDLFLNQANEVKLQIKCGRCQMTALSFAEIKFHLLYAHGEEIQGRLQEGILSGSKRTQEDLVRHAAAYWKEYPERRKAGKERASEEEACALAESQRPLHPPQQSHVETLMGKDEGAPLGSRERGEDPQGPPGAAPSVLWSPSGFNCLLCTQTLGRQEELLLHWEQRHNCQAPARLWALLNEFSSQGGLGLAEKTEK
ncbi:zinc finger protein 438 isoform X2 [Tamandua tetradactyla]|uniref:zinc finger protein 438 isoform X2 n=1 Tax=Tamandua tetradactyla TaxID=48850 RepID=UPI004053FBA6